MPAARDSKNLGVCCSIQAINDGPVKTGLGFQILGLDRTDSLTPDIVQATGAKQLRGHAQQLCPKASVVTMDKLGYVAVRKCGYLRSEPRPQYY